MYKIDRGGGSVGGAKNRSLGIYQEIQEKGIWNTQVKDGFPIEFLS